MPVSADTNELPRHDLRHPIPQARHPGLHVVPFEQQDTLFMALAGLSIAQMVRVNPVEDPMTSLGLNGVLSWMLRVLNDSLKWPPGLSDSHSNANLL